MLHLTTTCPDLDIAREIARAALREGLVDSASLQPGRIGFYQLGDQTRESPEAGLDFITNARQLPALVALIQARHPDERAVIRWQDIQTADDGRNWLADASAR